MEPKVQEAPRQDSKSAVQGSLNETEITTSIRSLQEETQQISELVEMEKSYSIEVSNQLKQIIMSLNSSYHIKPESISKSDSSISDAVLTPQGIVCVFYNSGNVVSRPLESIASEVLVRILAEVIPEVKILTNERRQKLSGRVMMLEKISKELRKVPNAGPRARAPSQAIPEPPQQVSVGKDKTPSQPQDAMRSVFGEK